MLCNFIELPDETIISHIETPDEKTVSITVCIGFLKENGKMF